MVTQIKAALRPLILPLDKISQSLKDISFSSVLDVGCGSGIFLREIKDRYSPKTLRGVDLPETLHKCEHNIVITHPDKLQIDEKFDLITFIDVLHHVKDKEAFLNDYINRHLQKGGYVLIKEMRPDNLLCKLFNRFHDLISAREIISEISEKEVLDYFRSYEVISENRNRVFLYDHYWILFRQKE